MADRVKDSESAPTTGQRAVVSHASKAKAKDYTDPRRHGHKAKGGPIERRWIEPQKG